MLRVRLLGDVDVRWQGRPLQFPTHKSRLLLAYLIHHRTPHTRQELAALLWGEMPERQARANLKTTLWRLRRVFREMGASFETCMVAGRGHLAFGGDGAGEVDTHVFERLADSGLGGGGGDQVLRQAAEAYGGPFLAGCDEEWCLVERQRLAMIYQQVLRTLVARHKERGEYRTALRWARRLVEHEALDEGGHQEVIRLLHLLGDTAGALRQYQVCYDMVQRELGTMVAAETRGLYEQIVAARQEAREGATLPIAPAPPPDVLPVKASEIPLVGRERELAELVGYVEQMMKGEGGFYLVTGEAGIGKTRLLRELASQARWRGAQVLWGQGMEIEHPVPYQPVTEAIRQGLRELSAAELVTVERIWLATLGTLVPEVRRLLPDLGDPPPLDPEMARARLLEAVAQYLTGLAAVKPQLMVLEDLHWADPATVDVLLYLVGHLSGSRLLIVGTVRSESVGDASREGTAGHRLMGAAIRRLRLTRLSAEDIEFLLLRILGRVD
ncbi:MAG: AAA family ATPase, partial [Armatimonadetes bacterium]|nr:AAA family ATPase [Armatimonadota bacterium]